MSGNLYLFSILLGTVILHGTAEAPEAFTIQAVNADSDVDSVTDPTSSTVDAPVSSPASTAGATAETELVTSTASATESTFTDINTEADQSSSTSETPNPDEGTEEADSGLTPAEAAGVAVGTIAGVAALGGGIFAGLKFSGKLG